MKSGWSQDNQELYNRFQSWDHRVQKLYKLSQDFTK